MYSPEVTFKDLFIALHTQKVHEDGKIITDAVPRTSPQVILDEYEKRRREPGFNLKDFFHEWFEMQGAEESEFISDTSLPVDKHIESLWSVLERQADEVSVKNTSLIPLPHEYIVPGGRFNEIYYWDSYFTMLGLQAAGKTKMIRKMTNNFAHLINKLGFIPNGNRSYFISRSQPPFFSLMVEMLAEDIDGSIYVKYLPALIKEYEFWMKQTIELTPQMRSQYHVVMLKDGGVLNRYYDNEPKPRAEMYGADLEAYENSGRDYQEYFGDIRAACESGWDFSSRWLDDTGKLASIHTTDFLPVDLNCLLYKLEQIIEQGFAYQTDVENVENFRQRAERRKRFIQDYCWNEEEGYYCDYNYVKEEISPRHTLAGMFPLYLKIATQEQDDRCAKYLKKKFLKDGGLITTTLNTGQQWDAPNGWAPLQWISIQGLRNYGHDKLAEEIKDRWVELNKKVYKETGKLLEKYNVMDTSLPGGGGEYPVQDGFGWTNGVLLALVREER